MHKQISLFFSLFFSFVLASAQVLIIVDAIPANTPANASIHIAGTFNNWDPGNSAYILQSNGQGQYSIEISNVSANQQIEYKFTRGSWPTVEGNANGNVIPNRSFTPSSGKDTVFHQILSWEDLGGSSGGSNQAGVRILDPSFFMPQLNRNRRIWVYLPSDYDTSSKSYPVMYMHDGQNLFDPNTSFAGEWKVDETLRRLEQAGDHGIIVIGIDNGGANRLNEYSPWVNSQYGGGDGDKYIRFIVETLKPHIDSTYRTMPGRETTAIAGSSMGGLISYYAGMAYQNVFGKIGVFSPSFWFSNQVYSFANQMGKQQDNRFYFLAGANEAGNMVMNMQRVYNDMLNLGFSNNDLFYLVKADGQHAEWFWEREFGDAYQWLFSDLSLSAEQLYSQSLVKISPNPVKKWLMVNCQFPATVVLRDNKGKTVLKKQIAGDKMLDISGIASGVYFLEITGKRYTFREKLVKL